MVELANFVKAVTFVLVAELVSLELNQDSSLQLQAPQSICTLKLLLLMLPVLHVFLQTTESYAF